MWVFVDHFATKTIPYSSLPLKASYPCWSKKTSSWHFFVQFLLVSDTRYFHWFVFFFVFLFLGRFYHLEPSFFWGRRCCGPWPVWAGRPRPRRRSWTTWRGESREESLGDVAWPRWRTWLGPMRRWVSWGTVNLYGNICCGKKRCYSEVANIDVECILVDRLVFYI